MKKKLSLLLVFVFLFTFVPKVSHASTFVRETVKVGLRNMQSTSLSVTLNGDYNFNGEKLSSGTNLKLSYTSSGILCNGKVYTEISLVPLKEDSTIRMVSGNKDYNYLGSFQFIIQSGNIVPVNTVDLEEYLKGVVPYEMSNSYPKEALKAQAVVGRTYAMMNFGKHGSSYDICDTTDCQVYRGYNYPNYTRTNEAVYETAGQVVLYNGKLAQTYFYASNGGVTDTCSNVWVASIPYLVSKADPFDDANWPYGDKLLTAKDIESTLKTRSHLAADDTFVKIDVGNIKYHDYGRVASVPVIYKNAKGEVLTKTFTKERTRTFLGFYSNYWTVVYNEVENTYLFSGKGYGHAIGLSQIGSRNRASAGHTYDQIISFYYSGTVLTPPPAPTKIKAFTLNNQKFMVGETASFSVEPEAVSTAAKNLYKFVVEANGAVVYTKDYGKETTLDYKVASKGNHTVTVYVKNKYIAGDYDDKKQIIFAPIGDPEITGITYSPTKVYEKNTVRVTVTGKNIDSTIDTFNIDVLKDGTKVSTLSNTTGIFDIPSVSVGKYTINAWVYDSSRKMTFSPKSTEFEALKEETQTAIKRQLKIGVSGSDVSEYQQKLKTLGYFTYPTITGYYGTVTANATKALQKANKLPETGVIDNATATVINTLYANKTKPSTGGSAGTGTVLKRVLKLRVTGDDVKEYQEKLKTLGYFKYPTTTTYYGTVTRDAVMSFQRANKLPVTGIIDNATATLINDHIKNKQPSRGTTTSGSTTNQATLTRTLKLGATGNDVKEYQGKLKTLGYFKYPTTTTYFGTVTRDAVINFQKANKLSATGIIDNATAKLINDQINSKTVVSRGETITVVKTVISRTLQRGMTGNDVKEYQGKLKQLGFFKYGTTTTYFGSITEKAVMDYQRSKKLSITGRIDNTTALSINKSLGIN